MDITNELLKAGWVKLKDMKREPNETDLKRREVETEARNAHKGIWNPHGPKVRVPDHEMRDVITDLGWHRLVRCNI